MLKWSAICANRAFLGSPAKSPTGGPSKTKGPQAASLHGDPHKSWGTISREPGKGTLEGELLYVQHKEVWVKEKNAVTGRDWCGVKGKSFGVQKS